MGSSQTGRTDEECDLLRVEGGSDVGHEGERERDIDASQSPAPERCDEAWRLSKAAEIVMVVNKQHRLYSTWACWHDIIL
jgi:hypothetical protein